MMRELKEYIPEYKKMIDEAYASMDIPEMEKALYILNKAMTDGRNIFTCGNGGSAAIAEHITCDFNKGVASDTEIRPMFVPLASNISLLTAIANDHNWYEVYSKQIENTRSIGNVLFAISSSGDSLNIVNACKAAKDKGWGVISFVGFTGGAVKDLSDACIHIKSNNYGVVEDCHHMLMHILAQHLRIAHQSSDYRMKL
jgi:phosphoheptose isomerase